MKLEEKACAKVNLHLEVLNKRSDGYHSIFSLMASLALHDRVTLVDLNVREGNAFHIDIRPDGGENEDVIRGMPAESNLVTKAVKEYFSGTGKACSASFRIEKNIPAGAGMGGGSSDAAAALRILDSILGYRSPSELVQTGFRVGADVPFCITGGTAICEGAGEIVTPLGVSLVGSVLVLNDAGEVCRPNESGQLVFASSWPAMVRGLWGQPERYWERYFSRIPGCFVTNDGARVDREGFFWGMGRLDDRIKVAGRSLSTSEVESTLAGHPRIAEAAVVGFSGDEGGSLVSFLVARELAVGEDEPPEAEGLRLELARYLQMRLGEFAVPARLVFVRELPRTRSGKVVRRVLRRIATGDVSQDEDWSAVANPGALQDLVRQSGR